MTFSEDEGETVKKHKCHFSIVTGDFTNKVGTKNIGQAATAQFGMDTKNMRTDQLLACAENADLESSIYFQEKRKQMMNLEKPYWRDKIRNLLYSY